MEIAGEEAYRQGSYAQAEEKYLAAHEKAEKFGEGMAAITDPIAADQPMAVGRPVAGWIYAVPCRAIC